MKILIKLNHKEIAAITGNKDSGKKTVLERMMERFQYVPNSTTTLSEHFEPIGSLSDLSQLLQTQFDEEEHKQHPNQ